MLGRFGLSWGILLALLAGTACNNTTQIAPPDAGSYDATKGRAQDDEDDREADDDDEEDDEDEESGDDIGELASGSGQTQVDYPSLDLHGNGSVSCAGKRYGLVSKYRVNIDSDTLVLDFYVGEITDKSIGPQANPKIAAKLGPTKYTRVTKKERDKLIKNDFVWAPYAVFAKSALKEKTSELFTFSDPLPIFPLPTRKSSYRDLEENPHSWQTTVSGGPTGSFTAVMTLEYIGASGDEVTLKMTLNIPSDSNRAIYEAFPIANEATYVVNTKTLDVRHASIVNWFKGDDQCQGRPEDITQEYGLCTKTLKGKTETYSCL